jgi:hypothetical protein
LHDTPRIRVKTIDLAGSAQGIKGFKFKLNLLGSCRLYDTIGGEKGWQSDDDYFY